MFYSREGFIFHLLSIKFKDFLISDIEKTAEFKILIIRHEPRFYLVYYNPPNIVTLAKPAVTMTFTDHNMMDDKFRLSLQCVDHNIHCLTY